MITATHPFRDLLQPNKLSADGVAASMNLDGLCGAQLKALARSTLAELAALLARTWRPQFRSTTQRCSELSTTCLWVLEQSDLIFVLENPVIRASGLARTLLLAEAAETNPSNLYGGLPSERALSGLHSALRKCWDHRIAGKHVIIQNDSESVAAAMRYIDERYKLLPLFGDAAEGVPGCLSILLFKIALLLHMARHEGATTSPQRKVNLNTMHSAMGITDALMGSHLNLINQHSSKHATCRQQPGAHSEIELVISRLKVRGELSIRDLVRSFHNRKTSEVESLVAAAIDAGFVQKDGTKLVLTDNGAAL
jgi:hypothetical protein